MRDFLDRILKFSHIDPILLTEALNLEAEIHLAFMVLHSRVQLGLRSFAKIHSFLGRNVLFS